MEVNAVSFPQDLQSAHFKQLAVDEQYQQLSQQFEALLLRQMLGKALKPIFKSALLGENNATDNYRSLFVDVLSQTMATASPLQMNQFIQYNQLNSSTHHETT